VPSIYFIDLCWVQYVSSRLPLSSSLGGTCGEWRPCAYVCYSSLSQLNELTLQFTFTFTVTCGRLSWLPVSFLLHVKHTLSYRIVSSQQRVSVNSDQRPWHAYVQCLRKTGPLRLMWHNSTNSQHLWTEKLNLLRNNVSIGKMCNVKS